MKQIETAGHLIGNQLDAIEQRLSRGTAAALGVVLAIGVVGGGIGAFVLVLAVLVNLLH